MKMLAYYWKRIVKKQSILLAIGLFLNVFAQIITHYQALPDFAVGILHGIGIGLMILALVYKKYQWKLR